MITRAAVALGMLALVPFHLEAQQAGDPGQRIEEALARAVRTGIPVELLQSRVAEGRAKGVTEERIALAVERRQAGLARAQDAFASGGQRATAADLSAGADALEAGVDGRALSAVIQAARAEDRPVALAVLGELVAQGLPVQNALDRVTAALERRGEALANLPQQVAAERAAAGRPPAAGRPDGAGRGRPETAGPPAAGAAGAGRPPTAGRPAGPAGPPAAVPGPGGRPDNTPGGSARGASGRRP